MKPVSPVIRGFEDLEVVLAKDQPQYRPLPAIRDNRGVVISHWKLTWWERVKVLLFGNLYLQQPTFGAKLQPQLPTVEEPVLVRIEAAEKDVTLRIPPLPEVEGAGFD